MLENPFLCAAWCVLSLLRTFPYGFLEFPKKPPFSPPPPRGGSTPKTQKCLQGRTQIELWRGGGGG